MLILLHTLFNVQHILSKNQCSQRNSSEIVNLQALTMKYEYFIYSLTYITTMILYSRDASIDRFSLAFSAAINHSFRIYRVTQG